MAVLTALAGTRPETAALPLALQAKSLDLILRALPAGVNAIIAGALGLCAIPTEDWLPQAQSAMNARSLDCAVADPSDPVRATEDVAGGEVTPHQEKPVLSLSAAGRRLGVSRQRVRELIDNGKLPAVVRPVLAVRPADVERLAREERRPGRPRKRPPAVA